MISFFLWDLCEIYISYTNIYIFIYAICVCVYSIKLNVYTASFAEPELEIKPIITLAMTPSLYK